MGSTENDRSDVTIEFQSFTGRWYYFRYVWSVSYPIYHGFRHAQVEPVPYERPRTFVRAEAEREGGYNPDLWDPAQIALRREAMIQQEAQGLDLNTLTLADRRRVREVLRLAPEPDDEEEDSAGASGSRQRPRQDSSGASGSGQGSGSRATKAVACQGGAWVNADREQPMVLVDSGANEVIRPDAFSLSSRTMRSNDGENCIRR